MQPNNEALSLWEAAEEGDTTRVSKLLLQRADPNEVLDSVTPLLSACGGDGNEEVSTSDSGVRLGTLIRMDASLQTVNVLLRAKADPTLAGEAAMASCPTQPCDMHLVAPLRLFHLFKPDCPTTNVTLRRPSQFAPDDAGWTHRAASLCQRWPPRCCRALTCGKSEAGLSRPGARVPLSVSIPLRLQVQCDPSCMLT